ncbi:hypothetical protein [Microbacterium sp. JZ31]|uniref:hypothetical protein n=1 Tax=Microbacterium sp. JZ31 TaxID=1906274 RepID=UPI0019330FBC|nr:hypothetical protein [Microbacterium sp. JZ31]
MIRARRAASALLAAAAMLALASCAPDAQPAPVESVPADQGDGQADPNAEPTCETILPESLVAEFENLGLAAIEEPFSFGDPQTTSLPEGLMCTWGSPEVATDHGVQLYGWAPMDAAGTEKWTAFLVDQGWTRTEGDGYVYLSDPFEGVEGVTYAFGADHVILADTKDGVTLVDWP